MNKDTRQLVGGSVAVGFFLLLFVFGPLPVAEGLYSVGLWPRLTAEELPLWFKKRHNITVTSCQDGTNGWQYICTIPLRRAGRQRFIDKLGVQGSPFGVGYWKELPPGPVPPRESRR